MSANAKTKFQVTDVELMKSVLTQEKIAFTENEAAITVKRPYNNLVFSKTSDNVSYDSDDINLLNKIKTSYSKSLAIKTVEIRGESYAIQETENEVTIFVC